MINVTTKAGVAGSWINPKEKKAPATKYHTVRPGDSLTKIAKKEGVSLASIKALNPSIENYNLIYPGQKIRVK
ncbi:LysM domain-containing protein [Heyndrickxia sporothermodurans]|nr:LysM domain-containing protein [Heyndrickxia sporothermodurans]MED3697928.1 LysM domain-containing protein [Heyndrickxia sporothermodurans]